MGGVPSSPNKCTITFYSTDLSSNFHFIVIHVYLAVLNTLTNGRQNLIISVLYTSLSKTYNYL